MLYKKSSTGALSSATSTGKSNLDSNKDAGIIVTPTGVTYSRVARANAQALPATGDDTNVFCESCWCHNTWLRSYLWQINAVKDKCL